MKYAYVQKYYCIQYETKVSSYYGIILYMHTNKKKKVRVKHLKTHICKIITVVLSF